MYVNFLTVARLISLVRLGKVVAPVATITLALALTVATVITYIRAVELARLGTFISTTINRQESSRPSCSSFVTFIALTFRCSSCS